MLNIGFSSSKKTKILVLIVSFCGASGLWAASVSTGRGTKLHTPAKATRKEEAALFKTLAGQITGVGLVTAEEKRIMGQTIEKEKSWILRRTMEQIYASAFDLYRQGRYQESLEVLNRIVTLDPSFERARALHSALSSPAAAGAPPGRMESPKSVRELIREKFYEAVQVYREGRRVEAVQKFEEVLALEPRHRKAQFYITRINGEIAKDYFEKGKFAQAEGRLEDALDNFYTAVSLDPKTYAFLSRQITAVEAEVRSKKLQFHLSEALKSLASGKYSSARSHARDIFQFDPANTRAQEIINESLESEAKEYFTKGDAHLRNKQFDKAVEEYEKVVKLKHRADEAKKKIELAQTKKEDEARRTEEAKKKKEDDEKAKTEAEERAKAASSSEKEKGKVVGGAAGAGGAEGGAPAAVTEEARRAAESHYQQAMVFYQSNDLQRALAELNLALKFDPNNQQAYATKRMIEQKLAK
ncbi:MAG: hypothetical protein HYT79_11795 [Elusimicrobia bacterium]|nr:hypothetical protein [Elusimicrobiota bacterium]